MAVLAPASTPRPATAPPLRLSIIMPAYNERETIRAALARVRGASGVHEIIVVDDCSTDGTAELLEAEPGIRLVRHAVNQGKGASIRSAIPLLTGDVAIIQDADMEYDPNDYAALVAPIARGEANVVYGSRFLTGRPRMRRANYIGNRVLAAAVRILFGVPLTDEATCYKAVRVPLLQQLPLACRRFEFCPEVTAKLLRRGERIVEVPVSYEARDYEAGKKIRPWDGAIALWTLLKYRFSR
jgi:dolichol-phosphate mannosyltransferase